jgi:hypothetical protein
MKTFPMVIELPQAIMFHGFLEPKLSIARQKEEMLVGAITAQRHLLENFERPWYEYYGGEKPIIVGHHDYLGIGKPFIYRERVYGLDTQCAFGGSLTGLVLPNFNFISVKSRHNHWRWTQNQHPEITGLRKEDESLTFSEVEQRLSNSYISEKRFCRLKKIQTKSKKHLKQLYNYVLLFHADVLSKLRSDYPEFNNLEKRQQAKIYTAHIEGSPLFSFLQEARKGKLNLEYLRKKFDKPSKLAQFIQDVDLEESEKKC